MSDTPAVGEIRLFASEKVPKNWLPCNGQLLPVARNTALFSLLGIQFGGNGQTTFALPTLPPLPAGNGGTLIYGLSLVGLYPVPVNPVDGMVGTIQPWPTMQRIPLNWLPCDGRTLTIRDYPDLASLIGTTYGGDGATTFALPNIPPLLSGDAPIPYCICTSGFVPKPSGSVFLDFISRVFAFASPLVPEGTVVADGSQRIVAQNQIVFALLGTRFGGNGNPTFNVPNVPPLRSGGTVDVGHRMFTEGLFPDLSRS